MTLLIILLLMWSHSAVLIFGFLLKANRRGEFKEWQLAILAAFWPLLIWRVVK